MDRAHPMLLNAGLDEILWTKAINIVQYLINQSSSTAIEYKIPYEI